MSNKELAWAVGLAPSSCSERLRRLREAGVFQGFHADVDRSVLGIGLEAIVSVRLNRQVREHVEGFRSHALELPEVVHLYHIGGVNDFLLHVAVRNAGHLKDLVLSAFTARPEVAHIETAIIFEHALNPVAPNYLEET